MDFEYGKITIANLPKPTSHNMNDILQWFGTSLGLFSIRDKDKTRFRIFIELMKEVKNEVGPSSDELASRIGLSRATIVHHLQELDRNGLIVERKKRYYLRARTLKYLIDELEKDTLRTFDQIREVAGDLDKRLGMLDQVGYRPY